MLTKRRFFYGAFSLLFLGGIFLASVSPALAAAGKNTVKNPVRYDRDSDDKADGSAYIIGPQNLLQIKMFGEASMNQIYRVEENGYIKHALIGRIKLEGLTVAEAEGLMERALSDGYIINPQVNIFVLEFSHFSIIGEVRKPGNYELSGRVSLIRAISLAGGFTPIANQRGVQIIRQNADRTETKLSVDATRIMNGDLSDEVELQADDVVVVPKSFF